jgi:hypothetical protein
MTFAQAKYDAANYTAPPDYTSRACFSHPGRMNPNLEVANCGKHHRKNEHDRKYDEDDLQDPHSSFFLNSIRFVLWIV